MIELALDADEYKLLSLVDGRRTLYDVCTQGPRERRGEQARSVAFQILQLVRPVPASAPAPSPEPRVESGTGAIKIRFKTQGDKFTP